MMNTELFNKELPFSIKEQLKEIRLSTPTPFVDEPTTYACAFDLLFRKGYLISVSKNYDLAEECFSGAYDWCVDGSTAEDSNAGWIDGTWFEAANEAILKAIELIWKKEDRK